MTAVQRAVHLLVCPLSSAGAVTSGSTVHREPDVTAPAVSSPVLKEEDDAPIHDSKGKKEDALDL